MKRILTTRDVEAPALDSRKRLVQTTTKEVDASPPIVKPEDIKAPGGPTVSTMNTGDPQSVAERLKRAEIIAFRKKAESNKLYKQGLQEIDDMLKISALDSELDVEDDKGFNLSYAVVEIDDLLQGMPRREMK